MISAEEIKALMAQDDDIIRLNVTCKEYIATLQTLLNQAGEALRTCRIYESHIANDAGYTFDEDDVKQALAAMQPYLTKEGE